MTEKLSFYHNAQAFVELLGRARKKYGKASFRLAGEGWDEHWKTLIATILSAQSKDEVTLPIAEDLFRAYPTLDALADARYEDVLGILKSMNYNKNKGKHVILCAKMLLQDFGGQVPRTIEELVTLPGVGRKTANLVITGEFDLPGICVDTHVHRICNVYGFVDTKHNRDKTELELRSFVPKKYWKEINRLFVLWGKDAKGYNKMAFEEALSRKDAFYD